MTSPQIPAAPPPEAPTPPAPGGGPGAGWRGWSGNAVVLLSLALLFVPPLILDPGRKGEQFWLGEFAKFMCLAILALSVDLVWGYTGLLTLGQGLFFGIGVYMVAYSLTLQRAAARTGVAVGLAPPQFMQYTGPAPNDPSFVPPPALQIIAPLGDIWLALLLAILVPTLLAALFGLVTFRLRIKGVYFALVTQALLLAFYILVTNQQRFTGGIVGIKDLSQLKLAGQVFAPTPLMDPSSGLPEKFDPTTGLPVEDPLTDDFVYSYQPIYNLNWLVAGALVACVGLCAVLTRTKFGKVLTAIRDSENRVLALGYNTALYKTFIFTVAGALAGLSGALFAAANRVCDSQFLSASFSIEAVIWVAVGGRGNLLGAVVGALLVGFGQSYISSAFPLYWPIILGALFVVVVLFLPRGLTPVAGRGALLGVLLGVVSVNFLEEIFGLSKAQRALLACPVILAGVFLPRVLVLAPQLLVRLARGGLRGKAAVQEARTT